MCSPASTAPDFTTLEDGDLFFRTAATDALQGQVLAQIAAERLGHDTASVMFLNNAYGNGLSSGFADAFESNFDGTVTASVSFSEGRSSYTSQLDQALADDPGVMVVVGYPASGVQIFRDYYNNYSSDRDILVSDGLQSGDLPGNVGRDMSNVSGTAPLGAGPGVDFFNQQYQNTYDATAEGKPFTRQSYDAAAVLVLANAAAGENTGTAVAENMRTVAQGEGTEITPSNLVEGVEMAANGEPINYQGVAGPVGFDDAGDLAAARYEYFQFTESGLETVEEITP
jgi:ABC-type branched-subunit amino acid transport system substrate-binding protein